MVMKDLSKYNSIIKIANELSQPGKEQIYRNLFEKALKDFFGVKYVILTSTCTSALFLSLKSIGIGKGDEVILPDNTYPSTIAPIDHLGATPILCDAVNLSDNMNSNDIESQITKNTKAIIIVHQNGHPANMKKILGISSKYNIPIIEDNARSFGAKWNNQYCGTFGYSGCLSFNSLKIFSTSGGGAILSNDANLYDKVRLLVGYGVDDSNKFMASGYNFQIPAISCVIGLEKIKYVNSILNSRKLASINIYNGLSNISAIEIPSCANDSLVVYPTLPIQVSKNSSQLRKFLADNNIITHSVRAIHLEPYYRTKYFFDTELPVSKKLSEESFCIHIDDNTGVEQVKHILESFEAWFKL
jgi:perosamine synthetase